MSLNILFISADTIKERSGLHYNVDEKLIKPEIKTAQDMYILPALGSALYDRLQDGINCNNLTCDEKTLLDDYIVDTLVNFVLSELPQGLSFQFYNKGLVRKSSDNTDLPSMQDLLDIANRYKARAEFYKQRLIKYLKEQSANGNFPLYLNWGPGIDAIKPDNDAYRASIWLGDDYCCKGEVTFKEMYQGNNPQCCRE
jgi:hypothetical protein